MVKQQKPLRNINDLLHPTGNHVLTSICCSHLQYKALVTHRLFTVDQRLFPRYTQFYGLFYLNTTWLQQSALMTGVSRMCKSIARKQQIFNSASLGITLQCSAPWCSVSTCQNSGSRAKLQYSKSLFGQPDCHRQRRGLARELGFGSKNGEHQLFRNRKCFGVAI